MGKFSNRLSEAHQQFIEEQKMFFVATAPAGEGRINVSPKGYDTLRIASGSKLLYADYAGSGNETANHLAERNQITLMWNSFGENPLILRIYGSGRVISKADAAFETVRAAYFPHIDSRRLRQLFEIEIELVQTSCGYGVPIMEFKEDRPRMGEWTDNQLHADKLESYIARNSDSLPAKIRKLMSGEEVS
ncbi:pyridoxamine 5'-phosphate oxidase family protein [Xylanibacillus composti]|uniref:Pyridoxamine 5'-phosphate oxidase n=1 Tax=Xylanibacillus composti TaxID=1572762 RepID=A0A8J4H5U7_9BACL|nr:pyridoxamine 5'-phosphate oxidase family protein [Xylanibacillus composti]GIQ69399.1 pyridoxamine 5'-phosphate oxidase [Xylanibacillus composti]